MKLPKVNLLDNPLARSARKSLALNTYLAERSLKDGLVPWMQSLSAINSDLSVAMRDVLMGERPTREVVRDLGRRFGSGVRYMQAIQSAGRGLFGSARYAGEQRLDEGGILRLSYLPADPGVEGPGFALFHVGGFLPYGDGIFRFLPEANLFAPFLTRGVPIYAIELDAACARRELGRATLTWLIDEVDRLAEVAFTHWARDERMVIEGYCGLALPMLAYLAAKPERARERFHTALTMVAPVDGRQCKALSELACLIPDPLREANRQWAKMMGAMIGDAMRVGMDIALGTTFSKTPLGQFTSGWRSRRFAEHQALDELDSGQRKELAGAYWISPENARRRPLPADLLEASTRLYVDGVDDDLTLPVSYEGRQLSLQTILDETDMNIVGIYGGRDPVVPPSTADVLVRAMGARYQRVVHAKAGHISYVLSPELWDANHRAAFVPDPLEAILRARP